MHSGRSLVGMSALVTGAAVRVGRTIAEALASRGVQVAVHYRSHQEAAESLAARLRASGQQSQAFQADLGEPGQALALADRVEEAMGPIDILVLSASEYPDRDPEAIGIPDFEQTLRVNLTSPFLLAHRLGMAMRARGRGRILTLLDWSVGRPDPRYLAYHVSKAALREATLGLARILAPQVQVNAIAPGAVLLPESTSEDRRRRIVSKLPSRHLGSPEDVAQACLYLLESSDFVTGTVLTLDGGRSLI